MLAQMHRAVFAAQLMFCISISTVMSDLQSQEAYHRGDGAAAHELSEEGKRHGAMMDQYNQQASDYIFRENNAMDRVAADTIDLHGQFVEEAERILEQRIRYAKSTGQSHLHVIVGKGNHSPGHIQKIKPRVEQICREEGLQFATEENAGRMFINLRGGTAIMPDDLKSHHGGGYASGYGGRPYQQQPHSSHQQPHHTTAPQQHFNAPPKNRNDEIEAQVKKYLPKVLKQVKRHCCVVM